MITIIIFLLGLIVGSFINALVWRIRKRKNWVNDRSVCTHCKHVLSPLDLVPVLSWLWLRGKCRYCHKPIDDNPVVEVVAAMVFGISYLAWPGSFSGVNSIVFASWLLCLVGLIALAVYDLRWMLLPNKLVLTTTIFASVLTVVRGVDEGWKGVLLAVVSAAVFFALFWLLFQVSGGRWIGGGDVKLAPALGLLVGSPGEVLLVLFVASFAGTLIVLPAILRGRLKTSAKIPFGPLLIFGTIFTVLWGQQIIDWYLHAIMFA